LAPEKVGNQKVF